MDTNDITLVQNSFAKVWPIKGQAARIFYSDLMETTPEVSPMFADTDMKAQGDKLMTTLNMVVRGLSDLPATLSVAEKLAIRHLDYGVRPEHYDAVGASLLRSLETGLGDSFTPEVCAAWIRAYATLADAMRDAAYPPPAAH